MTPEEAKKKKDHNGILNGDGSPITVGGGGGMGGKTLTEINLSCVFDDGPNHYPDPDPNGPPRRKLFKHSGRQIKTFKIFTTATGLIDHSADLPANGTCRIEVLCSGSGDDVTIYGSAFGIEMDTGTYSLKNGNVHQNPNANSYIKDIVLNSGGNLKSYGPYNKNDHCAVCTDYVQNSTKCS